MSTYPIYPPSAVTAKLGINYTRSLFESKGCLFHKIEHENDIGIDATVELFQGGIPLRKHLALQIKSGDSYFDEVKKECSIPVGRHRQYWLEYPFQVLGIVFVPQLNKAYWVDICTYLRVPEHRNDQVITYRASYLNELSAVSYEDVFMAWIQYRPMKLSREKTWELFNSTDPTDHYFGLDGIFNWYSDTQEVWDIFFSLFRSLAPGEELAQIIKYFAEGPQFANNNTANSPEAKSLHQSIDERIRGLGAEGVRKLLGCLGDDLWINGAANRSVVSIISTIPKSSEVLTRIIIDVAEDRALKLNAAIVLAANDGENALPALRLLRDDSFIFELIEYIEEYGEYDPFR